MSEQIPGPKALPFLGNIQDIDPVDIIKSLGVLADTYGKDSLSTSVTHAHEVQVPYSNSQSLALRRYSSQAKRSLMRFVTKSDSKRM